jgi:hypothetical protein
MYKIINEKGDYVEPNMQGEISAEYPLSFKNNFDSTLYNWKI